MILPTPKLKIKFKIYLAIGVLFAIYLIASTMIVRESFGSVREELYRWFDRGAQNLADSIASSSMEHVFPYDDGSVEKALIGRVDQNDDLLYASVVFGEALTEERVAGVPATGFFRKYVSEQEDNEGEVIVHVTIHVSTSSVEAKLAQLQKVFMGGAIAIFLALIVALNFIISKIITRPLHKLTMATHQMASGDLTQSIVLPTGDEFELLANSFQQMNDYLNSVIQKIRTVFTDLKKVSDDMTDVSETISVDVKTQTESLESASQSIGQLSRTITTITRNVERLFTSTEQATSSIIEVSSSIDQVADNAETLSSSVDKSSASIEQMAASIGTVADSVSILSDHVSRTSGEIAKIDDSFHGINESSVEANETCEQVANMVSLEGQSAVESATAGMERIRSVVADASGVIIRLGERVEGIGNIVTIIDDLAEQTNLLALNAAIIAAQAGVHGRSFAVVADEIRELAERTTSYIEEISKIVQGVQQESTNAVEAIELGYSSVEDGVDLISEVERTLRMAATDSIKAAKSSKFIAEATTAGANSTEQLASAAQQMATMSMEIAGATKEQSMGATHMLLEVESMRNLSLQVRQAMVEQSEAARLIIKASEEASNLAQNILDASKEEERESGIIVENLEALEQSGVTTKIAIDRLTEMVMMAHEHANMLESEMDRFKTKS